MPCMTQPTLSEQQKASQVEALKRLQRAVGAGSVQVVIGRNGGIAFKGWGAGERSGVSDLCAYRVLANAPEVRRAVFRAEAMSGNKLDPRAVASGLHSHDDGATWARD